MDNVLIGIDSSTEICGVYEEAKSIFRRAAMNLREWNSNSFESLEFIPSCERSTVCDATNVLGLSWNQFADEISIVGLDEVRILDVVTKRDVLHSEAKISDPLGLVSPVTFYGKVFLQKLWIVNVPWDKPLPMELVKKWKQVFQSLTEISSLKISQFGGNVKGDNQLLIFCDASTKAYATLLYLRLENGQTNLLFSKM